MRQTPLLSAVLLCMLAACSDQVPHITDPHKPVVDGETMSPKAFLERYCAQAPAHTTCVAVKTAMSRDATKGELPKGW